VKNVPKPTTRRPSRAGGITGKGFTPGQSGNPGGRPRGLAALVRERIGADGAPLFDALKLIAVGPPKDRDQFFGERVKVSTRDRLSAIQELADRGWGRPVPMADVGDPKKPVTVRFIGIEVDPHRNGQR